MLEWLTASADALGLTLTGVAWTLGLGIGLSLASIGAVTLLIVFLPANFFLDRSERGFWVDHHPVIRWLLLACKNLLGVALVLAGAAMLVGPGQGILTIFIGVMLLDFPGRRRLELALLSRPSVITGINRVRARFGKPPMQLPHQPVASGPGNPPPLRELRSPVHGVVESEVSPRP